MKPKPKGCLTEGIDRAVRIINNKAQIKGVISYFTTKNAINMINQITQYIFRVAILPTDTVRCAANK